MALKLFVLLPLIFHMSKAQLKICTGGAQGPCIGGRCPLPTQTCIQTAQGETCCENNMIADVSTTTTTPCVDKVNPRTGVSECASRANLCNDSIYYALMTEQCPRTCNRCPGTTGSTTVTTTCRDLVDYRTGVSNCAQMVSYCRNSVYLQIMREQCPRTCGYCT